MKEALIALILMGPLFVLTYQLSPDARQAVAEIPGYLLHLLHILGVSG